MTILSKQLKCGKVLEWNDEKSRNFKATYACIYFAVSETSGKMSEIIQ